MAIVNIVVRKKKQVLASIAGKRKITYIPRWMALMIPEPSYLISIGYFEEDFARPRTYIQQTNLITNLVTGTFTHNGKSVGLEEIVKLVSEGSADIYVQCEMGMVRSKWLAHQLGQVLPNTYMEQQMPDPDDQLMEWIDQTGDGRWTQRLVQL